MTRAESRFEVRIADARHYRSLITCQAACPLGTDAAGYVRALAEGRDEDAYLIARALNPFAAICGRICHAPCEAVCRRGYFDSPVTIRRLKRFATDRVLPAEKPLNPLDVLLRCARRMEAGEPLPDPHLGWLLRGVLRARSSPPSGERIAIIGAGPAGLAAAHDLALMGFRPTVFEAHPFPGGMLTLGVPRFRLPREIIEAEIGVIAALGVEIRCNTVVGRDVSFDDLHRDFAAPVVAAGLQRSRVLDLPGADGPGVIGGLELLRDINLDRPVGVHGRVVVIGGGGVAYDVARSALRLSAVKSVHMCCLEIREEMPVEEDEILDGDAEGVVRRHRLGPLEIRRGPDGRVEGVVFCKALSVFDEQGRFAPMLDTQTKKFVEADCVVWAIGQQSDLPFSDVFLDDLPGKAARAGVEFLEPRVVLAGDLAYGAAMVVDAIASGQRAAREVYAMLRGRPFREELVAGHRVWQSFGAHGGEPSAAAPLVRRRVPGLQSEPPMAVPEGRWQSARCFDCAVSPVVDSARCVLCGMCADVCSTNCIRLVSLDRTTGVPDEDLAAIIERAGALRGGASASELAAVSVLLKDEELCVRCGLCAQHCPAGAITMERYCVDLIRT